MLTIVKQKELEKHHAQHEREIKVHKKEVQRKDKVMDESLFHTYSRQHGSIHIKIDPGWGGSGQQVPRAARQ